MLETSSHAPSSIHGTVRANYAIGGGARAERLDDFLPGEENRLPWTTAQEILRRAEARNAASAVAADEQIVGDAATSIVVFYGPAGVGKSHLARGTAGAWLQRRPTDDVVVLSGRDFTEQYVSAVDDDQIERFRRRVRECDLLVVDDLSALVEKRSAQTELLHTLDALDRTGAEVVLTLPTSPSRVDGFAANLVTRLNAALCISVAPPAPPTRRKILARFGERYELNVADDALDLLSLDRSLSLPEACGTLLTLQHEATTAGCRVDASAVRRRRDRRNEEHEPSLKTIAEQTAEHFGLTLRDLKSDSRRRTVVTARDNAILLARRLTHRSLQEIGEYFGNRDHTTVLHSFRKLESVVETDAQARELYERLRLTLTQNRS